MKFPQPGVGSGASLGALFCRPVGAPNEPIRDLERVRVVSRDQDPVGEKEPDLAYRSQNDITMRLTAEVHGERRVVQTDRQVVGITQQVLDRDLLRPFPESPAVADDRRHGPVGPFLSVPFEVSRRETARRQGRVRRQQLFYELDAAFGQVDLRCGLEDDEPAPLELPQVCVDVVPGRLIALHEGRDLIAADVDDVRHREYSLPGACLGAHRDEDREQLRVLRVSEPTGFQQVAQFVVGDRNREFSLHRLSSWICPAVDLRKDVFIYIKI